MQNKEVVTPHIKINSKWIKDLTQNFKIVLEGNIGENLHDIIFSNDLLVMIPKAQVIKEKSRQIELHEN